MIQGNCCELMNKIVSDVDKLPSLQFLYSAEQKYYVREFKVSTITPTIAAEIYHSIYIKFKRNSPHLQELNWWENQLRIFIWILLSYLELRGRTVQQLSTSDYEFFKRLFPNKQEILFEYQSMSLVKQQSLNRKWTSQQDQLFSQLIQTKDSKYKWSELAKELYISSERSFFRTPKQCRERWLNHLDPVKSKQQWELKEDYILITHVRGKGKKWAEISKLLRNRRNEHSIKNRFKSLITKQQKVHNEKVEENILIDNIYRKYEHHFSKLKQEQMALDKQMGVKVQETRMKKEHEENQLADDFDFENDQPHEQESPNQQIRRVFQILPHSSFKTINKIDSTMHDIASARSLPDQTENNPRIAQIERSSREKQLRADIFLSHDPFDFLRSYFKSKE